MLVHFFMLEVDGAHRLLLASTTLLEA